MKLATHLACALLGALLAWWILRDVPGVETAAPAITLPSGAVVAERVPDAPLPPVANEAARELGGTVARAGSVIVRPVVKQSLTTAVGELETSPEAPQCRCEPVTLDWTLTNVADGQRMSFYTDDGTITGATDIPVSGVSVRRDRPWAAGASWTPGRREYGLWTTRDVGRLVIGAEVQQREREGLVGTLRVGWRF